MQSNAGIDDAHSNLNSAGKKKKEKKMIAILNVCK